MPPDLPHPPATGPLRWSPRRWPPAQAGRRLAAAAIALAACVTLALVAGAPSATAATPTAAATPSTPAAATSPVVLPSATAPRVTSPTTGPSATGPITSTPPPAVASATTPASSATPAGSDTGGGGGGRGGLFGWLSGATDIPGLVANAVDSWLTGMARDAAQPVLRLLGQTLLSTPDVTAEPRVRQLWTASLLIADSLFLLVLTVGGLAVMGEGSVHQRAMAREFAPRMTLAFGMAHLSLPLMGQAITFGNALERAILGQQLTTDGAASLLSTTLVVGSGVPVYLVLLGLGVVGMAIVLVTAWIIRMIIMMVLAVAAPLLLIWHGLPWTEALAALWWRTLAGCLAIQSGQAMLLLVGTRLLLSVDGRPSWLPSSSALVNTLSAAALFYLAIRLQGWVSQIVLRSTGGSSRSALRTLVQYRLLRQAIGLLGASSSGGVVGVAGGLFGRGRSGPGRLGPPGPGLPGRGPRPRPSGRGPSGRGAGRRGGSPSGRPFVRAPRSPGPPPSGGGRSGGGRAAGPPRRPSGRGPSGRPFVRPPRHPGPPPSGGGRSGGGPAASPPRRPSGRGPSGRPSAGAATPAPVVRRLVVVRAPHPRP